MKKMSLLIFCLALPACASTNKGRAAQFVVVSDGVADEIADGWQPFRRSQVDHCRAILPDTSDEKDRIDCLGIAAKEDELEAAIQTLVTVQVVIKEAIKCEDFKTCAQQVNWKELLEQIEKAWTDLKPFLKAVKGAK